MKGIEFCYWLNGFFDLSETDELTEEQVQVIKKHLALVFEQKVAPVKKRKLCKQNFPSLDTKSYC